jgi:hypothetical protein
VWETVEKEAYQVVLVEIAFGRERGCVRGTLERKEERCLFDDLRGSWRRSELVALGGEHRQGAIMVAEEVEKGVVVSLDGWSL